VENIFIVWIPVFTGMTKRLLRQGKCRCNLKLITKLNLHITLIISRFIGRDVMKTKPSSTRIFLDRLVQGGGPVLLPRPTKRIVAARDELGARIDRQLDLLAEARRMSWEDARFDSLD
jgi:hypothetical protein